eukprot:5791374-Alexandrium_andersonii.AAC.1
MSQVALIGRLTNMRGRLHAESSRLQPPTTRCETLKVHAIPIMSRIGLQPAHPSEPTTQSKTPRA